MSLNAIIVLSYAAGATMRPRGRPERSGALHVRNKQTGEGPTFTDVAHLTQKQVEHYLMAFGLSRHHAWVAGPSPQGCFLESLRKR